MKMAKTKTPPHPVPSLSKSALLLSPCVAWAAPDAKWYDDRFTDTTKRDRGSDCHARLDGIVGGNSLDKAILSTDDMEMENWVTAGYHFFHKVLAPRCQTIMSEVAIAVNWAKGEAVILHDVKDRNYPKEYQSGGWQCGTADLVCILKDGTLLIADWKTGGTDGATEQLLSLAWGFQRCMSESYDNNGVTQERRRPVRIACLKVFENGVVPDERPVSDSELALHRDSMLFSLESVEAGAKPVAGIHCSTLYCPHLAFCSAVTGIVDDAAEGPNGLLAPEALTRKYRMTDKPTSPDEAGFVMARVTAAKRQLDYYSNAMKEYVNSGGYVTCGSYAWGKGKDGFRWRKQ
jgi:hypothetical protein